MNRVKNSGFWFVLPGLLGLIVFYLWPFVIAIGNSFMSRPIGGYFVGLRNYTDLFDSQSFLLGLRNTAFFVAVSVPLNVVIPLCFAKLVKSSGSFKPFYILVFLIPLVIPSGSMVFIWRVMFSDNGIINGWLHSFGVEPLNWLNSGLAVLVVLIIFMWRNIGFNMVLFVVGLSNVPKEYYEAAKVNGASCLQTLRNITLPCLIPTFAIVLLMSIINSFKAFREVFLLMGNHPHESVYMLQHFMNNNFLTLNFPRLAAVAVLLVAAISILAWLFATFGRWRAYEA